MYPAGGEHAPSDTSSNSLGGSRDGGGSLGSLGGSRDGGGSLGGLPGLHDGDGSLGALGPSPVWGCPGHVTYDAWRRGGRAAALAVMSLVSLSAIAPRRYAVHTCTCLLQYFVRGACSSVRFYDFGQQASCFPDLEGSDSLAACAARRRGARCGR